MVTKRAVLISALVATWFAVPIDPAASVLLHSGSVDGWFPTIHITSNAWFLSRPDCISFMLSPLMAFKLHVIILFTGLAVACRQPVVHSALGVAALVSWFGSDPLVIPALSLSPWLMWSLSRSQWSSIVISCLLAFCAQTEALYVALLVFMAAVPQLRERGKNLWNSAAICALPALILLAVMPSVPFPDYPAEAHLVPDDGVPGIVRPLIGPAFPIPVINREAVKAFFSMPALALLVCLGAFALSRIRLGILPIALGVSILVDASLSEGLALIGPLQALSRMIPGLFLVPSAYACAGSIIILLVLAAAGAQGRRRFIGAVLLAGLLLVQPSKPPAPSVSEGERQLFASPSLYVLQNGGAALLGREEKIQQAKFTGPRRKETIFASNPPPANPQIFKVLLDRRGDDRRWSPAKGKQEGIEWLHVALPELRHVDGIELDPGAFVTDFPRGLEIATSVTCADVTSFSDYSAVVRVPRWEGPIKFTSQGQAYFGGQHEVQIVFPATQDARCIVIKQIGIENHFDWSISEFRLLLAGNEPEQAD